MHMWWWTEERRYERKYTGYYMFYGITSLAIALLLMAQWWGHPVTEPLNQQIPVSPRSGTWFELLMHLHCWCHTAFYILSQSSMRRRLRWIDENGKQGCAPASSGSGAHSAAQWWSGKGSFGQKQLWFYLAYGVFIVLIAVIYDLYGIGTALDVLLNYPRIGTGLKVLSVLYLILTLRYIVSLPSLIRRLRWADEHMEDAG